MTAADAYLGNTPGNLTVHQEGNPMKLGTWGMVSPEQEQADQVEQLRAARVASARRCARWEELPAGDLVLRERHWYVSTRTDRVYTAYRGSIYAAATDAIIATEQPLFFVVSADNEITFYERYRRETWTEMMARREEKAARRQAAART